MLTLKLIRTVQTLFPPLISCIYLCFLRGCSWPLDITIAIKRTSWSALPLSLSSFQHRFSLDHQGEQHVLIENYSWELRAPMWLIQVSVRYSDAEWSHSSHRVWERQASVFLSCAWYYHHFTMWQFDMKTLWCHIQKIILSYCSCRKLVLKQTCKQRRTQGESVLISFILLKKKMGRKFTLTFSLNITVYWNSSQRK